jgi:S-DNA-T family DNA segregation ATPase FtsK/SpoIIIE
MRDIVMSWVGQEIPLAVINTTEALWREDKRPQIHSKKKIKDGWEFVFALPAGMTFRQFAGNEEAFRDAIGDVTTELMHVGKMVVLNVIERKIPKKVIFDYSLIDDSKGILPILIGFDTAGKEVYIDLAKVFNVLIGGYIGSGKTTSVNSIVNTLLYLNKPPKISIIDFKMVDYQYLKEHVLLITDLFAAQATLSRMVVEMHNRLNILVQTRCVSIEQYNDRYGGMDYIVLVIDELADLKNKQAQEDLEEILRKGRAPGFRVILATQRPDCEIFGRKSFGACKANLVGRLCFQVSDGINSKIILDSTEAATLPKIPGRAIWKHGTAIEIQTPYLDAETAEVRLIEQPPALCRAR